jgi:hypothetical protein
MITRLTGLSLFAGLTAFVGTAAAEAPRWHSDYEAARRLARGGDKPLFVVFR